MSASDLLRHYERVADAPGAIERLRRFVLDLAIRGKLVDQSHEDEPASELLSRVRSETARLSAAGLIRPPKPAPQLVDPPFEIPSSWCWTRLTEVGLISPRNDAPDDTLASFVPMTLVAAEYGVKHGHEIRPWGEIKKGYTHFSNEDVGLAKITPCFENGKSTVFRGLSNGIGAGTTELHVVRPVIVSPDFVVLVLKSPYFIDTGIPKMTGTAGQKRVPAVYFANSPFPLPPLAEQHRIVAKVDELMALCDRLEFARAEREAARNRLTAASLTRLNTPDPETFREDADFALGAFASLAARQDQVPVLRRTILNLATLGKLLPQDADDEPASALLERIAASKSAQKRASADPRIKDAPTPKASALPMQLPKGWAIQSFENLFLFIDYRGNTPTKTADGVPLITAKNVRMGRLNREPREFISPGTYKSWMTRGFPKPRDLFFTTEAPLANVCLNDITEPFALAQRVICLQPYSEINTEFLMLILMSDLMQSLIDSHATGLTAKGIKAAKLKPLPIPIAPLAEQGRIVAKVNELMALCDQLETSLVSASEHRRRLFECLLHEALEPMELQEEMA